MLDKITPIEDMIKEAKEMESYLEITCSEQIQEMLERGFQLSVYLARSGKLLADAKYWLNQRKQTDIMKLLEDMARGMTGATATLVNELVKSVAREEQHLVDRMDRINRTITHQLDMLRTAISYEKTYQDKTGSFQP